jgi:hypothetical protein
MNPLIKSINAHVQVETLAPRTVLSWDPPAGVGFLTYECADYFQLKEDGSYFGQPVPSGSLSFEMNDVLAETVDVEVAPGVFQPVPMVLVAGALKAHFKKHIAARRAAQQS